MSNMHESKFKVREPIKGRSAIRNTNGCFESYAHEAFDDGWDIPEVEGINNDMIKRHHVFTY